MFLFWAGRRESGAGVRGWLVRRTHYFHGRAIRMSEKLQAGMVWMNPYRAISFMAPFGGYKDSGLGRENGIEAIMAYLQTKSVWINSGAATANPFVMR